MSSPICLLAATLLTAGSPAGDLHPDERLRRVGGDLFATAVASADGYRSGPSLIDESLPAGYPAPTPPGAIDLKRYPSVRRAEIATDARAGTNGAFLPLFRHISSRGIAMTTPVEVDLTDGDRATSRTMSFLYRTADLGPLGRDGAIQVVDAPPVAVISVGLRGGYGDEAIERGLDALDAWLAGAPDWQREGAPRSLYYNGPMVRTSNKWAEVQIPVRFIGDRSPTEQPIETVVEPSSPAPSVGSFIALAVERGAPLYNAGQPEACIAVYEIAARGLLGWPEHHIPPAVRRTLHEALDAVDPAADPRITAWMLRRALDAAYVGSADS